MSAGWLYYHKYPPKRKCPVCGKRHNLVLDGTMSNGADVWVYPRCNGVKVNGTVTSDGLEFKPDGRMIAE